MVTFARPRVLDDGARVWRGSNLFPLHTLANKRARCRRRCVIDAPPTERDATREIGEHTLEGGCVGNAVFVRLAAVAERACVCVCVCGLYVSFGMNYAHTRSQVCGPVGVLAIRARFPEQHTSTVYQLSPPFTRAHARTRKFDWFLLWRVSRVGPPSFRRSRFTQATRAGTHTTYASRFGFAFAPLVFAISTDGDDDATRRDAVIFLATLTKTDQNCALSHKTRPNAFDAALKLSAITRPRKRGSLE